MKPGKTYKYRMCNVSLKNSLNFKIQGHPLKLVEMDSSHIVQNVYESLDIHIGQCFSVLATADKAPKDYSMIASTEFAKQAVTNPITPKLSEYYCITDKFFQYNTISGDSIISLATAVETVKVTPNVMNITFKTFVEIIFENHEKNIQS